jgi:hypothetical protein
MMYEPFHYFAIDACLLPARDIQSPTGDEVFDLDSLPDEVRCITLSKIKYTTFPKESRCTCIQQGVDVVEFTNVTHYVCQNEETKTWEGKWKGEPFKANRKRTTNTLYIALRESLKRETKDMTRVLR